MIGYPPGAPMTGEAVPTFLDLVDRGIIRVLDALCVRRDADGRFSGFDLANLDQDTAGDLTAFAGAATGLLDDGDVVHAAAEIQPGSAALITKPNGPGPFVAAVRRNGGVLISNQRSVQDLRGADGHERLRRALGALVGHGSSADRDSC